MSLSLGLAIRLAWRDFRGDRKAFRIFIACIALGVAAIVAVGSTARSISESVTSEGRRILGGDIALSLIHREATADERTWMESAGSVSSIATMRAMAHVGGDSTVVELKAVDERYPAIGSVVLSPAIRQPFEPRDALYGAVAEDAFFERFGLAPGDRISIGEATFELRARLKSEPDKLATGMGFGPRVIISHDGLRKTGLIQPGSLVRWTYRIVLPEDQSERALEAIGAQAKERFPDAGWQIRSRENASPQLSRNIDRFTQFLTLVGLTTLVVGGVGVGNAVRAFVDRRRPDLATLKALGASGGYVFLVALAEVLFAALFGAFIGCAIGALTPFALNLVLQGVIPLPFTPAVHPGQLALGALYGLLIALVFSLPALGRAHDVGVTALYRQRAPDEIGKLRFRYIALTLLAVVVFLATVYGASTERRLTMIYLVATAGAYAVLRIFIAGLLFMVRRAPRSRAPMLRYAIANIARPGGVTQPLAMSLGLGLSVLVTLSIIETNLKRQIGEGANGVAPSFFFIDIPSRQAAEFEAFITKTAGDAQFDKVPFLRGRLLAVNDVPADQIKAKENAAWVLEGDRGITFASEAPGGSVLTSGKWWDRNHSGTPLVSVEAEVAAGLGIGVGDKLTVNVLGRNIRAEVANLRRVNWRSMGINFVFVFSPNTFAGAPHMFLATASLNGGTKEADESRLLRAVAEAYPTVVSVRVRETLEAVSRITGQLGFALRATTALALIASMLVLAGAIAAGQNARIYDAVVLKTLGADRGHLVRAFALEYGLVGAATSLLALIAGSLAAYGVLIRVMKLDEFTLPLGVALGVLLLGLTVTIVLGLAGTWKVLGESPADRLRSP